MIEREIGKIARPKNVWLVPDMPKTRSGKIMRRVIAGISNFADVGDVSTLANPEIVEQIRTPGSDSKTRTRRSARGPLRHGQARDRNLREGLRVTHSTAQYPPCPTFFDKPTLATDLVETGRWGRLSDWP